MQPQQSEVVWLLRGVSNYGQQPSTAEIWRQRINLIKQQQELWPDTTVNQSISQPVNQSIRQSVNEEPPPLGRCIWAPVIGKWPSNDAFPRWPSVKSITWSAQLIGAIWRPSSAYRFRIPSTQAIPACGAKSETKSKYQLQTTPKIGGLQETGSKVSHHA